MLVRIEQNSNFKMVGVLTYPLWFNGRQRNIQYNDDSKNNTKRNKKNTKLVKNMIIQEEDR